MKEIQDLISNEDNLIIAKSRRSIKIIIFYNCICVCTSISIICILFLCHVTNLALWLQYFNKLTYMQ